jgi:vacuolar-type H+-ATPase subunit H
MLYTVRITSVSPVTGATLTSNRQIEAASQEGLELLLKLEEGESYEITDMISVEQQKMDAEVERTLARARQQGKAIVAHSHKAFWDEYDQAPTASDDDAWIKAHSY